MSFFAHFLFTMTKNVNKIDKKMFTMAKNVNKIDKKVFTMAKNVNIDIMSKNRHYVQKKNRHIPLLYIKGDVYFSILCPFVHFCLH